MSRPSTSQPTYTMKCGVEAQLCQDGTCVPKQDLCPEQEELNEHTLLILLVFGAAVLVFLVVLYCFQHKSPGRNRNGNANQGAFENIVGDGDNASLNLPPPSYSEVINTNLYPPTPNTLRCTRMASIEEPITPPPNYDTALHILARSQENVCSVKNEMPVIRRSISSDISPTSPSRSPSASCQRGLSSPAERI